MTVEKAKKIYHEIRRIANNCQDSSRKDKFLDLAENFKQEFIDGNS